MPDARYGTVYTVQRGDTLYSISWAIKQDFRKVASWNSIRSPYVIHPGQRLRMYPTSKKATKKEQYIKQSTSVIIGQYSKKTG